MNIGGYVSLIESCVESGDLSVLAPLSVKDLIWVNVAQALKECRKTEQNAELISAAAKSLETIYMAICDCRDVALDSNLFLRLNAIRGVKGVKLNPFDTKLLPSSIAEEKKEEKRREQMTPEELAEEEYRDFMAGKQIRRKVT